MMIAILILALCAPRLSDALIVRSTQSSNVKVSIRNLDGNRRSRMPGNFRLQLSEENDQTLKTQSQKLARLNAMAAKLRAEASAMEVRIISFHFKVNFLLNKITPPTLRANLLYADYT